MLFRFTTAFALVMLAILSSQGQEPINLVRFSEPIISDLELFNSAKSKSSNTIKSGYGYFNRDPWLDITRTELTQEGTRFYVSYGSEDGTYDEFQVFDTVLNNSHFYNPFDLNNDGLTDLVSFTSGGVFEIYINNGNESFRLVELPAGDQFGSTPLIITTVRDDNTGTGKIFATYQLIEGNESLTKVRRFLFDSLGNFTMNEWVVNEWFLFVGFNLLNSDDEIDLVTSENVYLSTGIGTYEKRSLSYDDKPNLDFNSDGAWDFLDRVGSEVVLQINDGQGNLGPVIRDSIFGYPASQEEFADFTGNGQLDLLLKGNDGVAILTGDGNGNWSDPVRFQGDDWKFVEAVDVNSDGLMDLVRAGNVFENGERSFRTTVRLNLGETRAQRLPDIAYFAAEPDVIAPGGSTTLSWSVQNADQVTIEPIGGEEVHEGSMEILVPETTTYTLTATNGDGSVSTSVTVSVEDLAPVIDTFTLAPSSISPGGETTLSWQVRNADEVTIYPDIGVVDPTGERVIAPSSTQRYVLTATRDDQVQTRSVLLSVLSAPEFIDSDNYWIQSDGSLVCVYPDPTSDGTVGNYSYVINFYQNCNIVYGPVVISDELWPIALTLDPEDVPIGAYTIGVRRVNNDDAEAESPETIIAGPEAATAANGVENFQRWLLHIPRAGGGFKSQLKMHNTNRLRQTTVTMRGFDRQGSLLSTDEVTLAAAETRYFPLADGQSDSLFADVAQNLAYIGISEPGALTQIHQQYESESSGFSTWVEATDFQAGTDTGNAFELEAQKTEDAQDGVAILNLRGNEPADVWVVQRNQNDELISEINLGGVAPGEKALWVISDLFEFVGNAKYTIESRSGATIQVIGLSFSSSDFYTPIPVLKLN